MNEYSPFSLRLHLAHIRLRKLTQGPASAILRPQWQGNKDEEGEKEMWQGSFFLFSKKCPVFCLPSWLKVP